MAEIRLIDGNELRGIESLLNTDIIQASKEASWLMTQVLHDIDAMPAIDPETLPIVRELRDENLKTECRADALMAKILVLEENLKQVTAERDAAVRDLYIAKDCNTCALRFTDDCLLEE